MYKLCVFAGTTEGRELVEFLTSQPCTVTACVATEYGETLLEPAPNLTVSAKRLNEDEMAALVGDFDLVLDATHPYAQAVTENIRAACARAGAPYLRVLREGSGDCRDFVYVPDIPAAVEYLNTTEGNILLTTGSKELLKFTGLRDFENRVYARVLPMDSSLAACKEAGLKPARIIAMQGPFSLDMNTAMLEFTGAKYLVTKDGGTTGGFPEKAEAARRAGASLVVIGRPPQVDGLPLAAAMQELEERFGFACKPRVQIVGIGPGSQDCMTAQVQNAIRSAACLVGAPRMLDALCRPGQKRISAIAPDKIAAAVYENRFLGPITVVMSGDSGFFSGTKKLLPLLDFASVSVLPGLSSMSVLCARLGVSYEDVHPVSLHGRARSIAADVRRWGRVFALVGGADGVQSLCRALCEADLGDAKVSVGQRLSYTDEAITIGTAQELQEQTFDSLSAVLVENPGPKAPCTHGLADDAFLRAEGVPMTKEEIRSISLSKLALTADSLCWDIGAGTGSVSVEMALQCHEGAVYAVERKQEACEIFELNRRRFGLENLHLTCGLAPEACRDLPAPTHAFIGGSAGNMDEILSAILQRNPNARIVATAIALETAAELTAAMGRFAYSDVVCVNVAKGKKAGPYHLMMGANPVYIFTMQGVK